MKWLPVRERQTVDCLSQSEKFSPHNGYCDIVGHKKDTAAANSQTALKTALLSLELGAEVVKQVLALRQKEEGEPLNFCARSEHRDTTTSHTCIDGLFSVCFYQL